MATVLIIDKQSDQIAEQFKLVKGIFTFSVKNLNDARNFLESEQFDVLICDHSFLDENNNFFDFSINAQPMIQNYLIIAHDADESELNINGVAGYLKRPIHPGQINSLSIEELLDQRDINAIFD